MSKTLQAELGSPPNVLVAAVSWDVSTGVLLYVRAHLCCERLLVLTSGTAGVALPIGEAHTHAIHLQAIIRYSPFKTPAQLLQQFTHIRGTLLLDV
jgi:hypothetical protein